MTVYLLRQMTVYLLSPLQEANYIAKVISIIWPHSVWWEATRYWLEEHWHIRDILPRDLHCLGQLQKVKQHNLPAAGGGALCGRPWTLARFYPQQSDTFNICGVGTALLLAPSTFWPIFWPVSEQDLLIKAFGTEAINPQNCLQVYHGVDQCSCPR